MKNKKPCKALRKEIEFLEALDTRCPEDEDILKALGDGYTKAGRYDDGLTIDVRLTGLFPDQPVVWYNHACSCALLELKDQAFESLNRAVKLGYGDIEFLRNDHDLESLRDDDRYKALLKTMEGEG